MKRINNSDKIVAILNNGGVYTAQEVFSELENIDLATVYRNLDKLVKLGVIREILLKKGECVYELRKDDHQHATCNECGKVYHIEVDKIKLLEAIDLKGFQLEDFEVNIKGHCIKSS
jgi:Fe2+ or Zn2+ uptake regulation protein